MSQQGSPDRPSLDTQLAELPLEVAPERDLWPAIRASIAQQGARPMQRVRLPLAWAAGIGLGLTAGLLGWQLARVRAPQQAPAVAGSAGTGADSGFAVPASANYLRTRAALERTYRERLELLAPATRERIEHDLAIIRAANADIRRALAADPESAVLNRLLESTWQQEFDLYATVVRNTEPAVPRNRT